MSVTMSEVYTVLADGGYDIGVFGASKRRVSGLHLLPPGGTPEMDAVNLCPTSTFLRLEEREGYAFVCTMDEPVTTDYAFACGADLLLLRHGPDITTAANTIMREMSDASFANEVSSYMFSVLTTDSALKLIVSAAGEALGCQMVLGDSSRNVLVHNVPDVPIEEVQWDVFVGRGVAPAFTKESGCRIFEKKELYPTCVLNMVDNSGLGTYNVTCDIMADGRQAACLSLLVDTLPLTRRQTRVLSALCVAIQLELENHGRPDAVRALSYEGFLINLLESRVTNPEHIRVLASKISMPVDGFFTVFAFSLPDDYDEASGAPVKEMLDSIEAALLESRAVSHNGMIIVLVDYRDREGFAARDYNQLYDLIARWRLRCGMSRPFNRLYDVHKHFLEALDSLEIAKYTGFIRLDGFGTLNYYERCEPLILVHEAAEHGVDLRKFVHPFAMTLYEYDREHDTEYIRTLFEYIRQPKKPLTAEKLFIHRNTLDYRLKKIQELVGFRWDDGETLARMFYSIMILLYLKARGEYTGEAII